MRREASQELTPHPNPLPEERETESSILGWLPRPWRIALLVFAATRIPLAVFAGVLEHFWVVDLREGHFLYHGGTPHGHWLVNAFQKWDAYWFLNIVREGYQFFGPIEQISGVVAGQPETNVTPFPLFPMLMRAGSWLVGDAALAGLLLSQIFFIVSMVLLYRLVRLAAGREQSEMAVWLFAVMPWTYAFSAIYSESLFFALTVGSVLALRRNRYGLAGVLGMLSALTRLPGIFIALPLAIEYVRQRGWRNLGWQWLFILLVPAGTLIYFAYLWRITGEPFAYFVGQQGWHKELVGVWYHPVRWITSQQLTAEMYLEIVVTVVVTGTLVLGYRRIAWSDWIYAVFYFFVLMSSSYLLGLPRYAAALYPLYLIWAGLGARHPIVGRALIVCFAMLAPLVFWVWTMWRYAF